MVRRILVAAGLVLAVMLAGQSVVQAAPPGAKSLWLANYTVSVNPPSEPVSECIYSTFNCGVVVVRATFGGLNRISGRPAGGSPGPSEGNLMGTTQVARTYGCQDASGKRLRSYDRTVAETVELDTRRSSGFFFPPTGDTVEVYTFGYLTDGQPGNCPAGTTAMTYKIVAKQTRLQLISSIDAIAGRTYCAPARAQWVGAVPAPAPVLTP